MHERIVIGEQAAAGSDDEGGPRTCDAEGADGEGPEHSGELHVGEVVRPCVHVCMVER